MHRTIGAVLLAWLLTLGVAAVAGSVWPTSWHPGQTKAVLMAESARVDENGDRVDTIVVYYEDSTFVRYAENRPVTVVFHSDQECALVWVDTSSILDTPAGKRVMRAGAWGPPRWELRTNLNPACPTI